MNTYIFNFTNTCEMIVEGNRNQIRIEIKTVLPNKRTNILRMQGQLGEKV